MKLAHKIYQKFITGDALSDAELDVGIHHFQTMANMLYECGPVFRLAAAEADRTFLRLQAFKNERRL